MRSAGTVHSDVFLVRNAHVNQKFFYLLTMVSLNNNSLVLFIIFWLFQLLSSLSCFFSFLADTAVSLEVLFKWWSYVFPEFEYFLEVKAFRNANNDSLALSSSSIDLMNMYQVLMSQINKLFLVIHFNNNCYKSSLSIFEFTGIWRYIYRQNEEQKSMDWVCVEIDIKQEDNNNF